MLKVDSHGTEDSGCVPARKKEESEMERLSGTGLRRSSQVELELALACAGFALGEAENCKMQHLVGVAQRKVVVMPVLELQILVEEAHEMLLARRERTESLRNDLDEV